MLRRIRWKIYMSRVVQILWQRCRILPPPLLCVSDFSFVYSQSEISVNQIMRCTWVQRPPKQCFEFRSGDRSRLTIETEYSSTGVFQCTISWLHIGYIYTPMYIIYIFITSNFIISNYPKKNIYIWYGNKICQMMTFVLQRFGKILHIRNIS